MTDRWATFDCYGTLIDWERGISDTLAGLWPQTDVAALMVRYHEIEPDVQSGSDAPYAQVLRTVLQRLADAEGLELGSDQRDALSRSLPEWPPFSDVADALGDLRVDGWKLAVLSNTDPELLDSSLKRIGVKIDRRITVVEAGGYKPSHGHWKTFFDSTPIERAQHVHVAASLFHDIAPCAELGLTAVWVNRKDETTDLEMAATIPTLETLPDVLANLVP